MYGRIFSPFKIGNFIILPEDATIPASADLPILLSKKGAFGSGEHETTSSCLEMMEKIPFLVGKKGLDLGSGTGILAIAAIRLGAESMVAVDIEWPAAVSCATNIRLNGVDERIRTVCGELTSLRGNFDFLLANIYADIHLALADEMIAMTRPAGILLLSGIPLQDKYDVQTRFVRGGCTLEDMQVMEEFTTLLFRRI